MATRATTPASPATRRLFTALWPGPADRLHLVAHRDAWAWPDGTRIVDDADLHATLHFIGAVPESRLDVLVEGLGAVRGEPVDLVAHGTVVWPGRIAVLALAPTPALEALHGRIGDALAALAIAVDDRPYAPHVTLARRAVAARPPPRLPPLAWRAVSFVLAESRPGRTYDVLATFPLVADRPVAGPRESRR